MGTLAPLAVPPGRRLPVVSDVEPRPLEDDAHGRKHPPHRAAAPLAPLDRRAHAVCHFEEVIASRAAVFVDRHPSTSAASIRTTAPPAARAGPPGQMICPYAPLWPGCADSVKASPLLRYRRLRRTTHTGSGGCPGPGPTASARPLGAQARLTGPAVGEVSGRYSPTGAPRPAVTPRTPGEDGPVPSCGRGRGPSPRGTRRGPKSGPEDRGSCAPCRPAAGPPRSGPRPLPGVGAPRTREIWPPGRPQGGAWGGRGRSTPEGGGGEDFPA